MICSWVLLALGCFTAKRWFWFWFIFSGANMCQHCCIWYLETAVLAVTYSCWWWVMWKSDAEPYFLLWFICLSVVLSFFLTAPLLPCMEKLLISLVPFRLLLTPIPPLPSVRPGLFLPVLPQSHCAGTWCLCGTFYLCISHYGGCESESWLNKSFDISRSSGFLYPLHWEPNLHLPVPVRKILTGFVVTKQDGSSITSSVHWQVG